MNKLNREFLRILRQIKKLFFTLGLRFFNHDKWSLEIFGPDIKKTSNLDFLVKTIAFFSTEGFEKREKFIKLLIALENNLISRYELFFEYFYKFQKYILFQTSINSSVEKVYILGSDNFIDYNKWKDDFDNARVNSNYQDKKALKINTIFSENKVYVDSKKNYDVSILLSIYNGMNFFEEYMEMLLAQTIFDRCELIIVDANSSDGISVAVKKFLDRFKNIKYIFIPYRIKIYEAWNIAIINSNGRYLTNANVDDVRNCDSLEIQRNFLDLNPRVSVTYQDFYYSLSPNLDFNTLAEIGIKSSLPSYVNEDIIDFNSPHNAPMWRKEIHTDIGLFDGGLESAGDWDFWIRAILADKIIKKNEGLHVGYFHNPKGISTNPNGKGISEGISIRRRHFSAIVHKFYL